MFDYLTPHSGPVIPGLEQHETVFAKDQPQYRPLRTLPGRNGDSAICRYSLTHEQRQAIAEGADLYLEILHFKGPLAPHTMMVMSEPGHSRHFKTWWKAQTNAPYEVKEKLEV